MFPAQKFTGCPNSPVLISLLFYISGSIPAEGKWSSRKMGMQINIWGEISQGCAATVPNLQNKFPLKNGNKLTGSIHWFNWIMVLVGFKRTKKPKMIWGWKQNSLLRLSCPRAWGSDKSSQLLPFIKLLSMSRNSLKRAKIPFKSDLEKQPGVQDTPRLQFLQDQLSLGQVGNFFSCSQLIN